MHLRDGNLALWRRDGESQIGADPRIAVVLDGLSPGQQRALDTLARRDLGTPGAIAESARCTVPEVRGLLRRLTSRGLLTATAPATATAAVSAGAARGPLAGAAVGVLGGHPLGLGIARVLATAGVGTVAVVDSTAVRAADVGGAGYHPADLGQPREVAAIAHLRHARAGVGTGPPTEPDVVVVVESRVSVPFRASGLVRQDVPHLTVVLRELDVVVGPAVRPGRDACLRCLDLHRTDADPCWPALATQLAVAPAPVIDPATLATAMGVAAAAVLAMITGRDAPWGVSTEVAGGHLPRRRWAPHPDCGCGAHH